MPTMRIPPGVVIGDSRASILGRWRKTSLIRWRGGRMEPVGGWQRKTATPLALPPRNALVWLDNQYARNSAFFCDGKIYREVGGVFTDITPTDYTSARVSQARVGYGSYNYGNGLYGTDSANPATNKVNQYFPTRFGLENWGQQLLFCGSSDGRVFYWDPANPATNYTLAEGLPGGAGGSAVQDIIVTEERHLVLLGYGTYPNRVAWSEQEDRTNWNFTNVTGSAGFQDLESNGKLVTARRVQGGVLIFSTTAVYFMAYVGSPFIYSIKKIADGCPPISAQSIAVFAGNAYWMGERGFFCYSNGTVTPLIDTLGDDVFQNLDPIAAPIVCCAGANYAFPEVWFFYPRTGNMTSENTDYVIFNFVENWWANGTLQRSCFVGSGVDNAPVATTPDGHVYDMEQGFLDNGLTRAGTVWAEGTASFDDAGNVYSMTQGQVDTGNTDPKSIQIDIRARVVRNGTVYPKGPYIARADGKIDMRLTATDFDFRVTGKVDALWALGAMITDAKQRGPR